MGRLGVPRALALLALAVMVSAAAPRLHAGEQLLPWTAYFGAAAPSGGGGRVNGGSFSWLDTIEKEGAELAPWAGSYRGIGRTRMSLKHFQEHSSTGGSALKPVITALEALLPEHDVIVPVGGLPVSDSTRGIRQFIEFLERDGGEGWKQLLQRRVGQLQSLCSRPHCLAWQLGNEINKKKFSVALREVLRLPSQGRRDDPAIIPFYVEHYLAPSVESLHRTSRDLYGNDRGIRVVLGSVAGFYRDEAQAWLDALLDYEVQGIYAPALAGRRVYELIDIVSYHYLLTRDNRTWEKSIDGLLRRWLGRGRISGFWATEELGLRKSIRGHGAATVLKVLGRYLHWWQRRGLDAQTGRAFFWGWRLGNPVSTGEAALDTVLDFVGVAPLQAIAPLYRGSGETEQYAFESTQEPGKRLAIIMPAARGVSQLRLPQRLAIDATPWSGDLTYTIHVFRRDTDDVISGTASPRDGTYELPLGLRGSLSQDDAMLLLLERETPHGS